MITRLLATAVLFLITLFFPWWFTFLVGVFLVFRFDFYFEFVLVSFFIDAVFGGAADRFYGLPYFLTLLSFLILLSSVFLRRRLLIYD
jgi:hypothetical protein